MFTVLEGDFLDLYVDYEGKLGTKDYFDKRENQWFPGDPPEITLKAVYVGHSNGRINILSSLSGVEVSKIKDHCLEIMENSYEKF